MQNIDKLQREELLAAFIKSLDGMDPDLDLFRVKKHDVKNHEGEEEEYFLAEFIGDENELIHEDGTLSLYEAATYLDLKVCPDSPGSFMLKCTPFWVEAIINKEIDPIEPLSLVPYSKLPIYYSKEAPIPDMDWRIHIKDLKSFAKTRWPEGWFEDISPQLNERDKRVKHLGEFYLELEEQTGIDANTLLQTDNEKKLKDNEVEDYWNSKNEREFTYRTIGALALLLIEKTDTNKFGTREKPNKKAVYDAIGDLLSSMGLKEEGQGKTRLNDVLKDALDLVFKKPLL